MAELWWRVKWLEAVWSSGDLKPLERLVAAVYADHAHDKRMTWVTLPRLCERTGMSRDAANRALRGLRSAGWLVTIQKARQHRATVYALVIPEESSSTGGVPLSSTGGVPLSNSSSTPPDPSSTRDDTSSTPRVPNPSSYPSSQSQSSSGPRSFLASACGWQEEDERLDLLDNYLRDNNVKRALPWLKTCHEQGDLGRTFREYVRDSGGSDGYWPAANSHVRTLKEERLKIARMRQKAEDGDSHAAQRIDEWQQHGHPFVPSRNDPDVCGGIWDEEVNEFVANCGRLETDFAHLCHGRRETAA